MRNEQAYQDAIASGALVEHYASGQPKNPIAAQKQLDALMADNARCEQAIVDALCGKMGRVDDGEID